MKPLLTALTTATLLLLAAETRADTFYVAPSGSDSVTCDEARVMGTPRRTIMGATGGIACLTTPGDRLILRGGTYEESINSGVQALPSGTSWDAAFTVAAQPGEDVTIRGIALATDESADVCVTHERSDLAYWIFEGLHVLNDRGGEGIWQRCPDHIRYVDLEVSTMQRQDQCIQGGGSFIEFLDVEVHDCGDPSLPKCSGACGASYGFYFWADDVLIDGLRLHDTTGYGLHLFSSGCDEVTRACPDRVVIRNSEIWSTGLIQGSAAILFANGTGSQAYNNVIRGNSSGISVGYGASNVRIYNNTVVGNENAGIGIDSWFGSRVVMGVVVENNLVVSNGGYGIVNSSTGSSLGEPVGTAIRHNIGFENVSGTLHDSGSGSTTDANLTLDPMFVDAAAHDFHLAAASPAIDVGADLSAAGVTVDLEGTSRPQGAGYDIGAYEYAVAAPPGTDAGAVRTDAGVTNSDAGTGPVVTTDAGGASGRDAASVGGDGGASGGGGASSDDGCGCRLVAPAGASTTSSLSILAIATALLVVRRRRLLRLARCARSSSSS